MDKNIFAQSVGNKVVTLLMEKRVVLHPVRKFSVWMRDDRLIVILNPDAIEVGKINNEFAHILSTRLRGCPVFPTNHRGSFLQVGYMPQLAARPLVSLPLDLTAQPSPYHIPVGETASGALWIDLLEADSIFVTGMRGMGKSIMLHGFIQALLNCGKVKICAWDGKHHAEFLRYQDKENFTLYPQTGLLDGLKSLHKEAARRLSLFAKIGVSNLRDYNADKNNEYIPPIALILDEVDKVDDKDYVNLLVKLFRASGVYPIFATNDALKSGVIAKGNLVTRICLPVSSASDSVMAYGHTGAQLLPKTPGRGLIQNGGRNVEFQAYLPAMEKPTAEAFAWHVENIKDITMEITQPTTRADSIKDMAESIRDRWTPDMNKSETSRLFGKEFAGASWTAKVNLIIQYLNSTSSTGEEEAVLQNLEAILA